MLRQRLPLLVTGVAGVAGFNAFHAFHARYPGQVFGIRPHQTYRLVAPAIIPQDSDDATGMRQLFDRFGFRSVLNCAGSCALKSCELDPVMARAANVLSAQVISENVRRHGARFVHLSSDLVFSGGPLLSSSGYVPSAFNGYIETDATDPVTVYGKTMVQGEEIVRARIPEAAILRISLPMGPSFNHHAGAIDWIQSRFRADRPATLYFDEVRSCSYCDDLNAVFERFLCSQASGIFHCGGPMPMTLYRIAQVVNRIGGYRAELLNGCPRIAAGPMPPRAGNVTMDSRKLTTELGEQLFQPWPLGNDLVPASPDWHCERPTEEARSPAEIVGRLYAYPGATERWHVAG